MRHLPLAIQIHLVAHQDHGHALVALDADDLVAHGLDVLEALLVDQTVNKDEALAVLDVQIAHGGELLGACRVQDLQHRRRRVHLDLLAVEVLYRRVVLLDEGSGDELNGQRRFSHAAGSQHDHFVFSHCSERLGSGSLSPWRAVVLNPLGSSRGSVSVPR